MRITGLVLNLALISIIVLTAAQLGASPAVGMRISSWMGAPAGHVLLFFCIGFLLARFVAGTIGTGRVGALGITAALILVLGTLDELRQLSIASRTAQFGDVVADLTGGLLGAIAYLFWASKEHSASEADSAVDLRTKLIYTLAGGLAVASPIALVTLQPPESTGSMERLIERGIAISDRSYARFVGSFVKPMSAAEHDDPFVIPDSVGSTGETETGGPRPGNIRQTIQRVTETTAHPDAPSGRLWGGTGQPRASGPLIQAKSVGKIDRLGALRRPTDAKVNRYEVKRISELFRKLAEVEVRDVGKIAYSPTVPQRARLKSRVDTLLARISQVRNNLAPSATVPVEEYVNPLKRELARLEIEDVRLLAYADSHPSRLLIRQRTEYLLTRIERAERKWSFTEKFDPDKDQYLRSLRIGLVRLQLSDRRMEHYVETYPPRTLVRQQISALKRKIYRTVGAKTVRSVPQVLVQGINASD